MPWNIAHDAIEFEHHSLLKQLGVISREGSCVGHRGRPGDMAMSTDSSVLSTPPQSEEAPRIETMILYRGLKLISNISMVRNQHRAGNGAFIPFSNQRRWSQSQDCRRRAVRPRIGETSLSGPNRGRKDTPLLFAEGRRRYDAIVWRIGCRRNCASRLTSTWWTTSGDRRLSKKARDNSPLTKSCAPRYPRNEVTPKKAIHARPSGLVSFGGI